LAAQQWFTSESKTRPVRNWTSLPKHFPVTNVIKLDTPATPVEDAVLQYLELCRKFWSMGGTTLDDWTNAIKIGKIPDSHP
jgi:hypothetical protein